MSTAALEAGPHPALRQGLELEVKSVYAETDSITSITFEHPDGAPLPRYAPGSHLVVQYGSGANAYSLTGSGSAPSEYSISVLRLDEGAGGSVAMHRLRVGDRVRASRPRSAFAPVSTATHHLLVAAGIGITPMLSHARAAAEKGVAASLLYVYRPGTGAHLAEARGLLGNSLREYNDRASFTAGLPHLLSVQNLGTHLYICGPPAFMDFVLRQAEDQGWPQARLHSESFGGAELDPGKPFVARLARSGISVEVPAGVSLLESLEAAGKRIPNMCRKGVCGECALPILAGKPHHRDFYLSEAEKSADNTMMCCVSRSLNQELELDL